MRSLLILLVHALTTLARLLGLGGMRSVVAENHLIKHPLLVINRSRHRTPALSPADRILLK
ncbi:MAG: hypothetical protein ACYDHM_14745 [Acidiferrobacterales bacterium]